MQLIKITIMEILSNHVYMAIVQGVQNWQSRNILIVFDEKVKKPKIYLKEKRILSIHMIVYLHCICGTVCWYKYYRIITIVINQRKRTDQ